MKDQGVLKTTKGAIEDSRNRLMIGPSLVFKGHKNNGEYKMS